MQITSQKYLRHNNLPCTVLKEAQQRSDYHTCRRDGLTSHKQTLDLWPSLSISWDRTMAYFKSRCLNVLDMATWLLGHLLPFFSYIHRLSYDQKKKNRPFIRILGLAIAFSVLFQNSPVYNNQIYKPNYYYSSGLNI